MNPPVIRLARTTLALSCAAAMLLGGAARAGAEVTYAHESEAEWKAQLSSGQIASVVINKRANSLRTTLKDGTYVITTYPKHELARAESELKAAHVHYTVLSKKQADQLAKKAPQHHKIRYIAGGILIGVIVIVGGVLLVRRRARGAD